MNWTKALITGVVGGIVLMAYNFVVHSWIMANAYAKYSVFAREQKSPLLFLWVTVVYACMAALLFAKSRDSWAEGVKGGMTFGFFAGLVAFAAQFYNPLVFEGFPYHLAWCWGGIQVIGFVIFGAVAGAMYKK